jgi:excisionase family DNA binding protein
MDDMNRPARIPQAATYAQVSEGTICRWIRDGRLPARRVGPLLLFVDLDDLDQLIRPVEPAAKAS